MSILCSCSSPPDRPEGKTYSIAYNALLPQGDTINYDIFLMGADGSDPVNITRHAAVDWVCHGWKNMLYFISDRDTSGGIYFLYQYDLSNHGLERLGDYRMANSWLDSRYDGTELIICRQEGKFRSFSIIDSTGYEIREILRTNQYQISDPAFSEDGKWIVFRSSRSGTDELWIADELGAHQRQVTNYPTNLEDPGPEYYHAGPPCWIPGTISISYTSRRNDQYHIFSIKADGTQNVQLTSGAGNQAWHTWTSDGSLLIYDGDQGGATSDIFQLNMKSQKLVKLTNTPYPERAPVILEYTRDTP
ncbi:MAG: PD40 domain-containing protein [Saprospiraceae bacterium]|nr:PD40 domain-containing protein [Saprospiraceae bacterium]